MSQLSPTLAADLLRTSPARVTFVYKNPWGDGEDATVLCVRTSSCEQCDVCGPTGGIALGARPLPDEDWWVVDGLTICRKCTAEQLSSPEVRVEKVLW